MTPDTLRAELARLGLSQNNLARALVVDCRLARRWCSGDAPIPVSVEVALTKLSPSEARRLLSMARGAA